MGAKLIAAVSLVIIGGMLADAIAHPAGTSALGSVVNGTLGTAGNIVSGVTANTASTAAK